MMLPGRIGLLLIIFFILSNYISLFPTFAGPAEAIKRCLINGIREISGIAEKERLLQKSIEKTKDMGPEVISEDPTKIKGIITYEVYSRPPHKVRIGEIEIHVLGSSDIAEIEYFFRDEDYTGIGVATQGVKKVIASAFYRLNIKRISARVFDDHGASVKVLERNGFKLVSDIDGILTYEIKNPSSP